MELDITESPSDPGRITTYPGQHCLVITSRIDLRQMGADGGRKARLKLPYRLPSLEDHTTYDLSTFESTMGMTDYR